MIYITLKKTKILDSKITLELYEGLSLLDATKNILFPSKLHVREGILFLAGFHLKLPNLTEEENNIFCSQMRFSITNRPAQRDLELMLGPLQLDFI